MGRQRRCASEHPVSTIWQLHGSGMFSAYCKRHGLV
ncbi:uncharacterized protein ANIA_11484 [Aspergillus nidulans FGSC A4]|uniref:Uncharacterized protein n=1 Tax=Emericella nidulans (strain FGSC A4 / ATCC 38163 / CBS 112.46 / NRRL 194 / M139) TaxID=227321 RepID=C8VG02_EMENI|nr:hypothetical protein [Aspergillus nidulans FGSC A4]CBF81581.1 TPA: hypothetical protein ANIA_11484 [Aspergillus nidulans FGSC A4]